MQFDSSLLSIPIRVLSVFLLAGSLVSCGAPSDREGEQANALDEPAEPPAFSGVYRVKGTTVEVESGVTREISGLVVLRQDGADFSTNFDLSTALPSGENGVSVSVEVIGRGTGSIDDDSTLRGTADTQLVAAAIPGVDARFAFLPRVVGPRIVSQTVARIRSDGSLAIEIESSADAGENYAATRTTAVGMRVGDVGSEADLPDVASGSE